MKILLAVDGSKPSLDAVQSLVDHADWYREKPQVELVTVHLPVPKLPGMGAAVGKRQLEQYYQEEGGTLLAAAKRKLDAAGVPYEAHVLVGPVAESIVKHAEGSAATSLHRHARHERARQGARRLDRTKVLHISDIRCCW